MVSLAGVLDGTTSFARGTAPRGGVEPRTRQPLNAVIAKFVAWGSGGAPPHCGGSYPMGRRYGEVARWSSGDGEAEGGPAGGAVGDRGGRGGGLGHAGVVGGSALHGMQSWWQGDVVAP